MGFAGWIRLVHGSAKETGSALQAHTKSCAERYEQSAAQSAKNEQIMVNMGNVVSRVEVAVSETAKRNTEAHEKIYKQLEEIRLNAARQE